MEIKIVPKVVQKEVYVTSDGIEFEYQQEAILHEKGLKAESIFGINNLEVSSDDEMYLIVNNQEEIDLLYDYIYETCGCYCHKSFDLKNTAFPALVVYNEEGDLRPVSDEDYRKSKHVCEMYEKMLACNKMKQ